MHAHSFVPSAGEIIFTAFVVIVLCFLVFASNRAKGDKSTATLRGKLSFFFMAIIAMAIGTVLAIQFPRHRSYALHYSPQEIAKIEAEGGPATRPHEPRVHPDSPARFGDIVKIVCGSAFCTAAPTRQEAEKPGLPPAKGRSCRVKSGTEALVSLYDPLNLGTNAAKVDLVAGPYAGTAVWIPGKWMHKL